VFTLEVKANPQSTLQHQFSLAAGYRGISSSGRASICLSPSCIHAASEILYNLSPNYESMDPCTDFERMACAGWDERYDLRPDQGAIYTGSLTGERSQVLLRHLLEAQHVEELEVSIVINTKPLLRQYQHLNSSPAQPVGSISSDRDNFIKLKTAYDACMDETAIKKYGIEPLTEILDQIADNFPLNDTDRDDCAHTISFLAKLGVPALIQSYVRADDNNPDAAVAQVVPPFQIGLPAKDFYENEIVVRNYEAALSQIIENVFPVQGGNSTLRKNWKKTRRSSVLDHSKELAHKVVELEKKLAVASPSPQDSHDITVI
jgi:endothelin-converting enzyme